MKAKCESCGCGMVGDYEEWLFDDPKIHFVCKTCLAIDAKTDNPDVQIGRLLEKKEIDD